MAHLTEGDAPAWLAMLLNRAVIETNLAPGLLITATGTTKGAEESPKAYAEAEGVLGSWVPPNTLDLQRGWNCSSCSA
jgi:hypothetical protein